MSNPNPIVNSIVRRYATDTMANLHVSTVIWGGGVRCGDFCRCRRVLCRCSAAVSVVVGATAAAVVWCCFWCASSLGGRKLSVMGCRRRARQALSQLFIRGGVVQSISVERRRQGAPSQSVQSVCAVTIRGHQNNDDATARSTDPPPPPLLHVVIELTTTPSNLAATGAYPTLLHSDETYTPMTRSSSSALRPGASTTPLQGVDRALRATAQAPAPQYPPAQ